MITLNLNTPLSEVPGIGPAYFRRLATLGLINIGDLLLYFPRKYEDLSLIRKIFEITTVDTNTIQGKIIDISNVRTKNRKVITKAKIADDTGQLDIVWFNQAFLKDTLKIGMEVIISGKIKLDYGKVVMLSPIWEPVRSKQIHTARIVPIYAETQGVTSKWLRYKIQELLPLAKQFKDVLPKHILKEENLMPYSEAINMLHFPKSLDDLARARERISFNELFIFQLGSLKRKLEWKETRGVGKAIPFNEKLIKEFVKTLPFTLTDGQRISTYEILKNLEESAPMLRLLEGDVGSGKTIVGTIAMLNVVKGGFQAAFMAPTEILANQHYRKIVQYLQGFNLNVQLLVGSTPKKQKEELKNGLANGTIDIAIGTHALIQEDVVFKNLGLAIIDEQHRFGVEQRARLKDQGHPHVLNMTATPIPRSLALTVYGDQDISLITEVPPGRIPIITRVISPKERKTAYLFIEDQIKKGRQAFVICPLIEESDVLQLRAAKEEYKKLQQDIFPELIIGLLHGRMKAKEKDDIMQQFGRNEINILVSTSVVEVGVDVPNSTIMMIEGADRFGLAQLHQFRGRVGRGKHQSYCFLFTDADSKSVKDRLKAMEDHTNGFKLAEIDLTMRGPGEVFGTRQSGIPDLKMASLTDKAMVYRTRKWAEQFLEEADGKIEKYPDLAYEVARITKNDLNV